MDTRIETTDEMVKKFHSSVRLGLTIEDSLILSGIKKKDFETMKKAHYLKMVENEEIDIDILPPQYRPRTEDIERFANDKEFQSKINKLSHFIEDIEKDKIFLKAKLLQDIHKAQESKTSNWMASKWLLEQVDPNNYGKNAQQQSDRPKETMKVEFILKEKNDEERLKRMENIVDKEINGVEKA